MIDMQTVRVSALNNRVASCGPVAGVAGAAVALGLLAVYLAILGRGVVTVLPAAGLVALLLLVTFRPLQARGESISGSWPPAPHITRIARTPARNSRRSDDVGRLKGQKYAVTAKLPLCR
jgi:hypothetical protein